MRSRQKSVDTQQASNAKRANHEDDLAVIHHSHSKTQIHGSFFHHHERSVDHHMRHNLGMPHLPGLGK